MNFDSESWFQRAKSKKISEKRCSRQRIENPKNGKRPIVKTFFFAKKAFKFRGSFECAVKLYFWMSCSRHLIS